MSASSSLNPALVGPLVYVGLLVLAGLTIAALSAWSNRRRQEREHWMRQRYERNKHLQDRQHL